MVSLLLTEFDRDLEEDLKGDLGGNLERLMVSLLTANRENGWDVDEDQAREDAQRLYDVSAALPRRRMRTLQVSVTVHVLVLFTRRRGSKAIGSRNSFVANKALICGQMGVRGLSTNEPIGMVNLAPPVVVVNPRGW